MFSLLQTSFTRADGLQVTEFKKSVPMSTYLACFIVCDCHYQQAILKSNKEVMYINSSPISTLNKTKGCCNATITLNIWQVHYGALQEKKQNGVFCIGVFCLSWGNIFDSWITLRPPSLCIPAYCIDLSYMIICQVSLIANVSWKLIIILYNLS